MKNQKGITLITLVITIVILIIVTGIVTYNGLEAVNTSQKTAFISELEMIQAKVNVIYEERKASTEKIEYYNLIGQDIFSIDPARINEALGQTSREGFKFFNSGDLKDLDLDNINQEVLINYDTREVVSLEGFTIDGIKYYKLKDIPNYLGYNVEYTNLNNKDPEFTVLKTKLNDNEYRLTIKNIVYNSNVNGGTLSYKLHGDTNWILNGENTSFIIKKPGLYDIKFTDKAGNETIKQEFVHEMDYMGKGLLAYYDGENNTGNGHSNNTTIWKDLSGNNKDANLIDFKFNDTNGWREKAIQLSGNGDKVIFPVPIEAVGTLSVEIVFTDQNRSMLAILSSDKVWGAFNAHTWENGKIYIGCSADSAGRLEPENINFSIPLNRPILLTYTYDGESRVATLYINGKKIANKTYNVDPIKIENFYIPTTQKQFGRINFYDQVLTQEDIKNNYEIDQYRFGITE